MIFCVGMWQWMKHLSTSTHLKQKTRQLSGQQQVEVDYLQKGKTINTDYYMESLDRMSAEIKKERPHMQKKQVLFNQDIAPYHKSIKKMVKLNELKLQITSSPTIFSRSGQQRILALCWPGKNAPGKEIWLQWRSDCRKWGLFWDPRRIILKKDQ